MCTQLRAKPWPELQFIPFSTLLSVTVSSSTFQCLQTSSSTCTLYVSEWCQQPLAICSDTWLSPLTSGSPSPDMSVAKAVREEANAQRPAG